MLTWLDFENTCKNTKVDFEHLCRIFFKYHYAKNATVILNQKYSNPGIETEPILIDGKKVGFQAKYFSSNISYNDILDSAKMVVKYYSGKIDKVVLFCNKDISIDADKYKETIRLLSQNNIEIELCCNNNMLDPINTFSEYAPIKCLFFNKLDLSDEWFKEKLGQSLKELEPRYTSGFHVNELEAQKHFDILYRNESVKEYLQELIDEAKKDIKYNEKKAFKQEIESIINNLIIPQKYEYEKILLWYDKFLSVENKIEQAKNELEKKFDIIDASDNRKEIYNELRQLDLLLSIIQRFDLAQDAHFKYIKNNILIVEGDAGNGKSHLLGYEAEHNCISDKYRSVLLLGQKFIYDKSPQEQIMQILGLKTSFHEFLLACEARGEIEGGITVIMIDAVNECQKYVIWKQYLNDIVEEIKKLKYVSLVCSIRTTYKKYIFTDAVQKDIEQGLISLIKVTGFKNNLSEAVPIFFNYYKIPITTAAFFEYEFENPLFLQTYCEAYSDGVGIGSRGIFALYNAYIKKEENKVRDLYGIANDISYAKRIIAEIGRYLFENNTYRIPLVKLYEKCGSLSECDKFIDSFLKAKVLVQYDYDDGEYVTINYERFADYIVAKYILDSARNYEELCSWVQQKLLVINEYGYFVRNFVEGQFAALSVLVYEKYKKEIINLLSAVQMSAVQNTNKHEWYLNNNIVNEYLEAYLYRADKDINADDFYNVVVPYIKTNDNVDKHLDVLIGLAGRNCSLNINETTRFFMQLPLKDRDYYWTIYINNKYTQGERVFKTVQYFLNSDIDFIDHNERLLYGQLLTWFLTSSNRILRDKSSRALIRLLKNDIVAMTKLLRIFSCVNDPYIISRLYGCVYGALLQTDDEKINFDELAMLCKVIFDLVFNKEIVFPDILLRDYALNIIEYSKTKHIEFAFEIDHCRPPYKSFKIPIVDLSELRQKYSENGVNWLGTSAIKYSMMPDYKIKGFSGFYGDFGRYTFQSALSSFKDVNIERVFLYAYSYIIDSLGYDNNLFSEYDRGIGYGRGRNNSHIERIGKKYEWIAMYHVLALVSDTYKLDNKYYNKPTVYKGTWLPFVRDFDPTLSIVNENCPHRNFGISLNRKKYTKWQLSNNDWAKLDDFGSFIDQVKIVDDHNEVWYALYFDVTDASGNNFEKERQSIWLSSTACLIKRSEYNNFINKFKNQNFYGRWFAPAEVNSRYNVFVREYVWSPAYLDEYSENGFVDAEIEVKKKRVLKSMPILKFNGKSIDEVDDEKLADIDYLSLEFDEKKEIVEESVKEVIASLLPCHHAYLWEEEYDYSKDDTIHISMPNGLIVNKLNLKQKLDGVWQKDGEIVCADFNLIDNSNVNGLYIREKYLREILGDELSIVWIGLGLKQHTFGFPDVGEQYWNELSSFIYVDKEGKLKEIKKSNSGGFESE